MIKLKMQKQKIIRAWWLVSPRAYEQGDNCMKKVVKIIILIIVILICFELKVQ